MFVLELIKKQKTEIFTFDLDNQIRLFHMMSLTLFLDSKFDLALFWCNKALNNSDMKKIKNIYVIMELFNLVIHYELGNALLVNTLSNSLYKRLYVSLKNKKCFEILFLQHMKSINMKEFQIKENLINIKEKFAKYC